MKAEIKCKSQNTSRSIFSISAIKLLAVTALVLSTTACSGMVFGGGSSSQEAAAKASDSRGWIADGTITLVRLAPAPQSLTPETMLGFLPGTIPALATPAERVGVWLSINRAQGKMTLFDGTSELGTFSGEGLSHISSGTFHIVLKQRNPLWYAPDSYFSARNLPVPSPGDKVRFRRGALGDFVMFLDKNTPMHSGPVWSDEIGGLRMEENDLSRIYYRLDVGSLIEVK